MAPTLRVHLRSGKKKKATRTIHGYTYVCVNFACIHTHTGINIFSRQQSLFLGPLSFNATIILYSDLTVVQKFCTVTLLL